MKKKVFLTGIAAAAAVASLTLVSCGGGNTPTTTTTTTGGTPTTTAPVENNVDVFLNYKNTSGISFNESEPHTNPIDGITYKKGDLLPTWKEYQTKLNLKLRDTSSYNEGKDDKAVYEHFEQPGWVVNNEKIDLFYNSTENINKMGNGGKAVNLRTYINNGKMPYFKAYLEAHPEIEAEISYGDNDAIYFTPYFDGYNAIERMFIMDKHVVELLLDSEVPAGLGLLTSGHGSTNTKTLTGDPQVKPFIDPNHNYPTATTTVKIDNGTAAVDLTIAQTTNIIKQQNELLSAGTTGKALLDQFRDYIDAAFGASIGEGKTYAKRSEVFTSGKAAYNTDELLGLMRVCKANPDVLFYDINKDVTVATEKYEEVEVLFPRGEDKSRIHNMLQGVADMYGVQGFGSEKENLYFDANGKMHDAQTTRASYDLLDKFSAMYKEGLVLNNFWTQAGTKANNKEYVNKYFAKTTDNKSSFGLLMYDYTATQSAPNDYANGLGTNKESRKKSAGGVSFAGYSVQKVGPVLAPLTYWATQNTWAYSQALSNADGSANKTGKELVRYYEENRAIKGNSWCIPSTSDNIEGAVKLMDYLFSEEGSRLHNFGPSTYWDMGTVLGEQHPVLKTAILADYSEKGGDIWDYFRGILGTTQGVGHVRPTALDYQSTNDYAKPAYTSLTHAVSVGVQKNALCKTTYTWSTSVPVSCYPSIDTSISDTYKAITDFWAQDKLAASDKGWVTVVINGVDTTETVISHTDKNYTFAQVQELMPTRNRNYLYAMARSVASSAIPDEAKAE